MKGYTEIQTQADWDDLVRRMRRFHDAILKEIHFSQRAYYVDEKSSIWNFRMDGQILIQGRNTIELYLSHIDTMTVRGQADIDMVKASIQPKGRSGTAEINVDCGGLTLKTERLYFRDRHDWFGQKVRLQHEVPALDAVPATRIDNEWRQCSNCRDAWKEVVDAQFSICPNCGKMTELA